MSENNATTASVALVHRPERHDDDGFRAVLHVEAHAAVFAGLPTHLRDTVLRQQLRAQAAGHREQFPDARYEIVEANGIPIGRIVTESTAAGIRVVDIALLAACRGRGIGTSLLRRVMEDAGAAGVPVRLEVAATNMDALRLYQRLGFQCIARSEIGLAMEWERPSVRC